ncbi:MAG: translation initiation factor [Anaeromyxobacteraceae bacterium]
MKQKKPLPVDAPAGPFNSAFAKLRAELPAGYTPAEPPAPEPAAPPKGPARAVVRLERKGRGGKEATVVEKLELPPRVLEDWTHEAKRALGCGGTVEGDAIALQGDQRDRIVKWLEAKGVRKVVRG